MLVVQHALAAYNKHSFRSYSTIAKHLKDWEIYTKAECTQTTHDDIIWSSLNLLGNTLGDAQINNENVPEVGTAVPPCWHHVYFPPRALEQNLASDGYESEFFPPEPFVQRMWAGAKMEWAVNNPLKIGDRATMITALDHAEIKTGRLGDSAFVAINKDIFNDQGFSMREQRHLAYFTKQADTSGPPRGVKVRKSAEFEHTFMPSSILLFRYSALTFNSHKIHFDHLYATQIEKHPACLVHGPLSGTLLINLLRQQLKKSQFISSFEYKCLMPLYVNQPITLAGKRSNNGYELWILNHDNHLAVKGFAAVK